MYNRKQALQGVVALAIGLAAGTALAESIVANGGFEQGDEGWQFVIPADAEGKGCKWEVVNDNPHSGAKCAMMESEEPARYALCTKGLRAEPGERYRLRVWVRAAAAATAAEKTPGVCARVTYSGAADANMGPLHAHIGLNNKVFLVDKIGTVASGKLPTEWKQLEAVVEVPAEARGFVFALFSLRAKGKIYWDDLDVEKMEKDTPLTATE